VLVCVGLFVPMVHLASYAQDAGYTQAQGVALVSLIGLGSLLGRFTIGGIADRIGRQPSLALMYIGLGLMLVLWWLTSTYWVLVLFALLFGTFYGGFVALGPTIIMDLYGPRAVSGIIGVLYTGPGLGTLVGPIVGAMALGFAAAVRFSRCAAMRRRPAHQIERQAPSSGLLTCSAASRFSGAAPKRRDASRRRGKLRTRR
jgi:MFS family permease